MYDNHYVDQPKSPADGYHLDRSHRQGDRVRARRQGGRAGQAVLHVLLPGSHPRAPPCPGGVDRKYKGAFDMGYEQYRELVFERQKQMGIMPADAELSPLNPYADETSVDGKPWNPVDVVRPWDSLSDDEKRLFSRMAEVYAGFLSHTDHEIGRLLDYLEESNRSTTRSSCSCPTTAPAVRAGRTARSTRTSSSTGSPTTSTRT